jgi:serine/threonine-protein kinase
VRGKYLIQSRLGEGGMAIVYKAHHELLDESRALKVIRPDLARDTEFMARFKNEAIMARKLNHPNAVRVDDLDIAEDGLPFIAMELVVGDTLKSLILQTGPLPVTLVLHIAMPVCEALDAAHKLGLIHRDIKPENIVLVAQRDGPPVPKILDFGISRLREETAQAKGLTQTGMVIGTPEYMSPEQVMGKRRIEIDGRSDLYSLGVVMYRMLTGELPFQGESTMEMILQHLKIPPKAPHQLKPGLAIPEVVSQIVMKALEKDRENRYATGAEMATAIRRALRKVEWGSVKNVAGPAGAKIDASGAPAVRSSSAAARPAPVGAAAAPGPPAGEKPIYRSFARIRPETKKFPTRWVLTLVGVVVLMGGMFATWKFSKSWTSAKHAAGPPAGTATPEPAKATELSPSGEQKTVAPPKVGPAATAANGQRPGERKKLTYDEQAKIVELNSLGAIYYREGGCAKALPIYEQVLEIDPHDPRAYAAVRKCYSKARSGVPINPAPTTPPDASSNP